MVARARCWGGSQGYKQRQRGARIEYRMPPSLASPLAVSVLGDLARTPAQLEGNRNLGINLGRAALSCGAQPALRRRTGGENQQLIAPHHAQRPPQPHGALLWGDPGLSSSFSPAGVTVELLK